MTSSINALDQVVVTGTVFPTELKAIPNSITVITAKQLEERGITHIDQLFRGDVPGLFASNRGADATFDQVTMFSRGTTAISYNSNGTAYGTNPIKTYVDGVEMANSTYLSQIDPTSIERIEILTGPQASTLYGSNAINGVMQIFTKRGTTTRPQLTLSLMSGAIQNNRSSHIAPEYVTDARVSGIEGRWNYNVGGSWNYDGPWTPGKQTQRVSANGGGRMDFGALTADVSARQGLTRTVAHGSADYETYAQWSAQGYIKPEYVDALPSPTTYTLVGNTTGLTLSYRATSWWSHEIGLGTDASSTESIRMDGFHSRPADTLLSISGSTTARTSQRYASTLQLPLSSLVHLNLTMGADHWRTSGSSYTASPLVLTGSLTGVSNVARVKPGKNSGAYVQGQLGLWDALFFTYGMRADWNPNIGDKAHVLPGRYGVSYTRDLDTPFGPLSAKLRGSYGRSIRPPTATQKLAVQQTTASYLALFGPYNSFAANPELEPEFQQGGEGGLELYLGSRASLVVTRYNQTVDNLIDQVRPVDSVRSLVSQLSSTGSVPSACYNAWTGGAFSVDEDGYCYAAVAQYVNAGNIRNQGWELQGSLTLGLLTSRGTYSWTKSRVIGVTPRWSALLAATSGYEKGRPFDYLPEHTWAWSVTYAQASTTLELSVNGTGELYKNQPDLVYTTQSTIRLLNDRVRTGVPSGYKAAMRGYVTSDLNGTHRFSPRVDALLQVNNLGNYYQNDVIEIATAMGRQTRLGLRIRY